MVLRVIIYKFRERIRNVIRSRTNPLTMDEAEEKTAFYSKLYLMFASLSLVASAYHLNEKLKSTDPEYKNMSRSEYYIKNLAKDKKVVVMNFDGFSKTDGYVIDNSLNEGVKTNDKAAN